MTTESTRHYSSDSSLAVAIPFVAVLLLLFSVKMLSAFHGSLSSFESGLLMLITVLAAGILLWWVCSLLGIIYSILQAEDRSKVVLPRWAPALLRRATVALLGLSVFAAPAHTPQKSRLQSPPQK